jgi:hypothetical protein
MPAKVDYGTYMASRAWKLKRKEVIARAENICERCFDADIRDIHHVRYERLGHEDIDQDLMGLCRPCHEFLSAERDVDPAVVVIQNLITDSGIDRLVMRENDFTSLLDWSVGPTSKGSYFHGWMKTTDTPERFGYDSYMDHTTIVVEVDRGIWIHFNSY